MIAALLSLHPTTLAFLAGVPMAILFLGITWHHVEAVKAYERRKWRR